MSPRSICSRLCAQTRVHSLFHLFHNPLTRQERYQTQDRRLNVSERTWWACKHDKGWSKVVVYLEIDKLQGGETGQIICVMILTLISVRDAHVELTNLLSYYENFHRYWKWSRLPLMNWFFNLPPSEKDWR